MILGLIPSRLNSKIKEKPLLVIDGLPIIVHSYKRAKLSKKLDEVIVCTDDHKIVKVVEDHGGKALMTSKKHVNGTDRINEVAKKFKKLELVIDVQGDQPLIDPYSIDKTIDFHKKNKQFDIVLPSMPITDEVNSKNIVKNIFSSNDNLFILVEKNPLITMEKIEYFKNLSVVSFTPKVLEKFSKSRPNKIEKIENIERCER